jgi:hypothetical protein
MVEPDKSKSTLFINGKIWQENRNFIPSFGIEGNRIIYAGRNPDIAVRNTYDEVIDLKNHLVLPAFTDGHVHLVKGSLMRKKIECVDVTNIKELRNRIRNYAEKNPHQKWLQGGNLNIGKIFPDADRSRHNIFDDIYSEKPLYISNYDYHSGICNSLAMEETGLLSHLQDFKEEDIPRNADGKPNGILKEDAMSYIISKIPESSIAEKSDALAEMIHIIHSYGITGVSDVTLPDDLGVYENLYNQRRLKLRINSYIPFEQFDNLKEFTALVKEFPKELFSIKGFKAYYDGALGSETANFKENYKGTSTRGSRTAMAESGRIYELAKKIDSAGMQIIIHAIGDQAVSDVLDICERLEKENGIKDRRFRIEHAQHIDENDFDRFRKLNVIVSVQPLHLKYDAKIVIEKLSEKTAKRTHNYRNLIDRGVMLNFGTDFPIVEIDPFKTIQTAVTRIVGDSIFYGENTIDLHNCIKAYTTNNAYASFNEGTRGSISEGKCADFMIMDDDLFQLPTNKIQNAKVLKTYFDGQEVYSYKDL